ncbi:uncharacterized protein STEHIDRAFT_116607 [Stereum hirsutum FP-91666 SS1]|uniref:F-box domain-containing protein n=1 Tax=Stereum hirsutum (strain FP-91666) TaxID=721885 RepID=R7RX77_STEHR|nr:uncharacterized protein STEHIDRAFT_116607 [Stereum hirsutum FP-91666 SS1]EIM79423.1 hypothetical protein STEHIDRAFT_116607 [Stereum hirsutum FP-91666 SS1]
MSSCSTSSLALDSQSAVERTPPEIIDYIFALGSSNICFGSSIPFPLLVSHVCGRWRDIALSSSHLWSTVACTQSAPRFPILKLLLKRSRNHPLDLHFDFNFPKGYVETYPHLLPHNSHSKHPFSDSEYESTSYLTDSDKISKRLSLLTTSHNPRIRSFSVSSTNYTYISLSIRSFPRGPNPHLSSFEVSYVPGHEEISRRGTLNFPLNRDGVASSLKRLKLRSVDLNWASTSKRLAGLKSLELGDHMSGTWRSYGRLQTILASTPSLETFILDNPGSLSMIEEWPKDVVVELPCLRRMVLAKQRAEVAVAILSRLRLPAVKWLEINLSNRTSMARERRGVGMHDEIIRLLVPLVKRVEVVRMCEVHPHERVARALLAGMSSLRVLILDSDRDACNRGLHPCALSPVIDFLSHSTLSHSSHSPLFVPHLSHLVLPSYGIDQKQDYLAPVIECRPNSFDIYAPTETDMLDTESILSKIGYKCGVVDEQ